MKTLRSNKGFSLIELMIVVAIIGILSAIAIPNFQKFQMKSRQSEAKTQLAGIFQAEKAFHQEWAQYFSDFRDIGYRPEGTLRYFLATSTDGGVNSPSATSGYTGESGAAALGTLFNSDTWCASAAAAGSCTIDLDFAVNTNYQATSLNINDFTASATADLDRDGLVIDQWTIDQNKALTNVADDVSN